MEVLDKGKAAAVTLVTETRDKATGTVIFENQTTNFIRGSGGFGGKQTGSGEYFIVCFHLRLSSDVRDADRGAATAANEPPSRKPDVVVEEKTLPSQAALYR